MSSHAVNGRALADSRPSVQPFLIVCVVLSHSKKEGRGFHGPRVLPWVGTEMQLVLQLDQVRDALVHKVSRIGWDGENRR